MIYTTQHKKLMGLFSKLVSSHLIHDDCHNDHDFHLHPSREKQERKKSAIVRGKPYTCKPWQANVHITLAFH